MIKASQKFILPIYLFLLVPVFAAGFVSGKFSGTAIKERPRISADATFKEVNANIQGKPYIHAPLMELGGFACYGWTNGKNPKHSKPLWVIIRCTR